MTALTVMIHIVISALTFIDLDSAHKYHDFAGVQGIGLIVLKGCLFSYWLWCYIDTKQQLQRRQKKYFEMLLTFSIIYMLAIPISICSTFMFAPYERQYVYTALSQILMFTANLMLLYQVSGKKSAYQAANLDSLGLLPMGGFGGKTNMD